MASPAVPQFGVYDPSLAGSGLTEWDWRAEAAGDPAAAFGNSCRSDSAAETDEQALIYAALERLPTYERRFAALLPDGDGAAAAAGGDGDEAVVDGKPTQKKNFRQVDMRTLKPKERMALVELALQASPPLLSSPPAQLLLGALPQPVPQLWPPLPDSPPADAQRCAATIILLPRAGPLCRRDRQTKEQDNERLLMRLRDRINKVGIQLPTVEVRFQDLKIDADIYVGNRALPTLINYPRNMLEDLLGAMHLLPSRKKPFPILHSLSGILKPGRMTLLLGPPGAGKTTLMLALAGKLSQDLRKTGRIMYNGHDLTEFIPQRTAAYISQNDVHIGTLTVRETLDFSARVQGAKYRSDLIEEVMTREKGMDIHPEPDLDAVMKGIALSSGDSGALITDYIMKILGLDICADTLVGNEMIRGISGGQKKRVTTGKGPMYILTTRSCSEHGSGEMVVGPKRTIFMDEISTGLDSSTTYAIVRCMRNFTHILQGTILMALLQPAPETYNLFDDILLLSEGQIVYHGPKDGVEDFLLTLGFKCPERKGIADFLQEVTSSKDQEQYWADKSRPYSYVPVDTMARAFADYEPGRMLREELRQPFDKQLSHPAALVHGRYGLNRKELFLALFAREWTLMKRDAFLYVFKTAQVAFVAFITMTVFFRTRLNANSLNDGNLYLGALFFALVHMMFNGFAEISITVQRLPMFFKQRNDLFFPAWAFVLPTWVLRLPYSIVEAIIWTCMTYYVIGFAPSPGRFFRHMLIMFGIHQMALGLFRGIGALGRSMVMANTFGSFALIFVFLLGGFIIAKPNIHPWVIWGYWISPLTYGQNAIAVNEFLAKRWDKVVDNSGQTLGYEILHNRGLHTADWWFWVGFVVLLAYSVIFNFAVVLALACLGPLGKQQATISEEALAEKHANRTGESLLPKGTGSSRSMSAAKARSSRLQSGRATSLITDSGSPRQSHGQMEMSRVNGAADGDLDREVSQARSAEEGTAGPEKGMILPFTPLALTFHHVKYYVDMPAAMKEAGNTESRLQLLNDISGAFRPGVLTALVGVSGAGKTTLMDVLAGRKTGGYIEGDIRVSGYPKEQATFARVAGYCEQNDIHSPQVTVQESLQYSALLRLAPNVDKNTREQFVEEVMDLVELTSLRGSLVGLPGVTGLSTEQRKRLTIAVELVANPSIIFMDEPTSGLDARAAAIVMRTVRNTVDTGRTVVCTIHQPSIDIFEAFDELLLLKRGGTTTYAGPLGKHSSILVDYFQAIEGVPCIEDGYNPATWMLDISTPAAEARIGQDFTEIYKSSELSKQNERMIEELSVPPEGFQKLSFPSVYAQGFLGQCHATLLKQHWTYWRSPHYNAVRFFFTLVVALIFGTIFWGFGSKRSKYQDVFNVMGALYAAVLFMGVNNSSTVQPIIAVERTVYYRERAAGMYSPMSYAIAQGLIEIPYVLAQTLIYALITYAMIHFQWTWAKFWWYTLFMFLTFMYFTFYGMMAVALTPTQQLAAVVSSAFYSIWNLFSGFLIPAPSIPGWWIWFYWICPIAWTLYGLIVSQLGDVHEPFYQPDQTQPMTVSQFVHSHFDYKHDLVGVAAVVLLGFVFCFWMVFALAIKYLNFQKR
eukprot:SM000087S23368  [mRNA]  locus=s87:336767:345436:+ [translate_table: standard]